MAHAKATAVPYSSAFSESDVEERKGLLSEVEIQDSTQIPSQSAWSVTRVAVAAASLILLIITGSFARMVLSQTSHTHPNFQFHGNTLRSNGTHDFKRTVLLVSIDGLRADYLDRGLTPHLLDISKQGIRAKYMTPIFPTLTFPNHWSLITGLYAESHGIIANNFWDPKSKSEFHYNKAESSWKPFWWSGEPIWETAAKAGIITANLMWPGPPKTTSGASSTYFVPWKNKVPLAEKLDEILKWIDLPLEDRPQLIMAYEPSLDQAGHLKGPNSSLVNATLERVDIFARDLHNQLQRRNLMDIVDVIFVSDHGMTDTSHPKPVYVDDLLGGGFEMIEHEDGSPSMGLRFKPEANSSHYLDILLEAADANSEKFDVYTRESMPERYHFSQNERIAPIWVVPKIGYALTNHHENLSVVMSKGNHGYDNHAHSMQAIFVAHGPFSTGSKAVHQSRWAQLPSRGNTGWHTAVNNTYVMEGFLNVEIYNLVTRLLGIEGWAAVNNGTPGFWDKYL